MLDPHGRRHLLEALRPDVGFALDCAVGTTFSLDLMALLAAPLAFTFFGLRENETPQAVDPVKLLNALQRHAGHIHLFCQAGRIQTPARHHPLYAFLESSVIEVQAKKAHRVFHPKIWVLRYAGHGDDLGLVRYRVLCLSRNLTFDRSWDTALVLSGDLRQDRARQEWVAPLSEFLTALPSLAVSPPRQAAVEAVTRMADELMHVDFALPEGVTGIKLFALGLDKQSPWPFDVTLDRISVVSPFVEKSLLERLAKQTTIEHLVARLPELQKLDPRVFKGIGAAHFLIDDAQPEAGSSDQPDAVDEETAASNYELAGLHGKLYLGERERQAFVWTGSANASSAAFDGNVEFLACLSGASSLLGIDAFWKGNNGKGFGSLLRDFKPASCAEVDSVQESLEKLLDLAREAITRRHLHGQVRVDSEGTFAVDIAARRELAVPSKLQVYCRPITLPQSRALPVSADSGPQDTLCFEGLTRQALTTFFAFRLKASEGGQSAELSFVLNLPCTGLPADREASILKDMLADSARLLQLILLLLQDTTESMARWLDALEIGAGDQPSQPWHLTGVPLFETMVRALHRDPSRIDAVRDLVDRLRQDPEAAKLLPADFGQIWQPVLAARQELIQKEERHGIR